MYKLLLIVIMFCSFHLAADEDSEQIHIRLATENRLMAIYLAKIGNENSGFDNGYLKKIEDVLNFDLNHNGITYTIPTSTENEKQASKLSKGEPISSKEWQPVPVFYLVKTLIKSDKKIQITLFAVNGDTPKMLEGQPLTGDLNKDRKQLHQLADAIYKALFGGEGIATTKILYSVKSRDHVDDESKWTADIWEADYDGANSHIIIRDGSYNISPVYIPPKPGYTAGSILYVSYKSAQPKIFVASLKEKVGRRLSYMRGNQLMPTICKQRDQIAFICDITGNPDLFLQDFSVESGVIGKPRQIFAAKKATQGSPTFSPDSQKIAFVTNKDGSPRIYTIDVPTPGTPLKDIRSQLITKHSKESTAPVWSPDGTKLAYCALTNGVRQIWMYDFETKEERQLTQGVGNKENPSWSPNSLCLVYNCSDTGACELFLLNINQGTPTKLALNSSPGDKRFPNWEPR